MAIEIKVPELPESVADGTIATWHVKEGDSVSRDQNLVDIETDKVVLEVVAEADGVVGKISAQEGDTVEGQQVIGTIEKGDSKASAEKSDDKEEKSDDKEDKSAEKSEKEDTKKDSKPASGKTIEVKVPELPESVSEATIATWHVKAGESVSRDQNLVDIETDKVVLEVVAESDGVLAEIIHDEGANVGAQDVIGKIKEGAAGSSSPDSKTEQSSSEKESQESDKDASDAISPSVRRLLAEHDLKASDVKGTGKDGRLTKEDVEKHVKSQSSSSASEQKEIRFGTAGSEWRSYTEACAHDASA